MLCIATLLRQFFNYFVTSTGYLRYATAGSEQKDKKNYVFKFYPS